MTTNVCFSGIHTATAVCGPSSVLLLARDSEVHVCRVTQLSLILLGRENSQLAEWGALVVVLVTYLVAAVRYLTKAP